MAEEEPDIVRAARDALAEPPTPRSDRLSKRDIIYHIRDDIKRWLEAGATYADIAERLSQNGVDITSDTLGQYYRAIRKRASERTDEGSPKSRSRKRGGRQQQRAKSTKQATTTTNTHAGVAGEDDIV